MTREHFFLTVPNTQGQRFCIYHPATSVLGLVLYIHPLADEMNKSRPMAAQQARAFAAAGFSVLQIDLLGCGDSSGEFEDATWASWIQDVLNAHQWLIKKYAPKENVRVWLWGIRAGCLLAAEVAKLIPCNLLFWQPAVSGQVEVRQFLRLRLAEHVLQNKKSLAQANNTVNVLGYSITPSLMDSIKSINLKPEGKSTQIGQLIWFEIRQSKNIELSPTSAIAINEWKNADVKTFSYCIDSPAFWCSNEISISKKLINKTTDTLLGIA